MNTHPANTVFHSLRKISPATYELGTWDEYLAADKARREEMSLLWCRIAGLYTGDGSQREEARKLYYKVCRYRRENGEARPVRRKIPYSTNPLDDDRAIIITEQDQLGRDAAFDAVRDAEGHR